MTHTPGLLRVREQSELDKALKSVMLEDDAGEFVIAASEGYGHRIAALWNMAERLGLSTEDIESGNVETKLKAVPDMLEALEEVVALTENLPVCPFCSCVLDHRPDCLSHEIDATIRKARGEDA